MKRSLIWCGAWAYVLVTPIVQAQATDPASPVQAVAYRSVFSDTPQGVETDTVDWKAANAEVGQFTRGHMDILKWEAAQKKSDAGKSAMPMPMPMPMSHGSGMEPKKP